MNAIQTRTEKDSKQQAPPDQLRRLNHALGPPIAGMIIDVVDLVTFGPIGLVLGLPVGGIAGWWLGRSMGLSRNASLVCAICAGVYCTIPFTELIPLGTIVGVLSRYQSGAATSETDVRSPETINS